MTAIRHRLTQPEDWVGAFEAIDFDWTRHLASVWTDATYDVPELNGELDERIVVDLFRKGTSDGPSPLGHVLVGPAGSGKTHIIGRLRQKVWERNGWFVLLDLLDTSDFWETAALSYLQSVNQFMSPRLTQGDEILLAICRLPEVGAHVQKHFNNVFSSKRESIEHLAGLVSDALLESGRPEALKYHAIVRAFILMQGRDPETTNAAYNWLQGIDGDVPHLGPASSPQKVVQGISWLMSLTAPTLLAVDQLDGVVAMHDHLTGSDPSNQNDSQRRARGVLLGLAHGLMELRDQTRRTMTLVSALEPTWRVLSDLSELKSVEGRFHAPLLVSPVDTVDAASRMVTARLTTGYAKTGFTPPYPSWPFSEQAFETALDYLPRRILRRCDEHIRSCVRKGEHAVLESFDPQPTQPIPADPPPPPPGFDTDFQRARDAAQVDELLAPNAEGDIFAPLLLDALRCFALGANPPADMDIETDADPNRRKPALHARLRYIYHARNDLERHWCFRAVPHSNAIAFQARLKAAMTASGIDHELPFRQLVIIRNGAPPSGRVTGKLLDQFGTAGGRLASLSDDELRTMAALQAMLAEGKPGFEDWLREKRPLEDIALFRDTGIFDLALPEEAPVLSDPPVVAEERAVERPATETAPPSSGDTPKTFRTRGKIKPKAGVTLPAEATIGIGRRLIAGKPEKTVTLPLAALAKHIFIVAGSGSGKTVLLRRIIEEAALQGVPSIVIDINNDLARLGDAWPTEPRDWDESDRALATRYRQEVEAVVWTPGLNAGNPVVFRPLPNFAAVRADQDELNQAIDMAHASVLPVVGATGTKGPLKAGILKDALRYFATGDGGQLEELASLLSDLPPDITKIGDAQKLAGEMADRLHAEMATNALLGASGSPLDPHDLLTARQKGRTRISVVNLGGLALEAARQAFVNQLQMNLFAWIKDNPAPAGRLSALLVLDEAQNFAPSGLATPSRNSTKALAAQARKYGLGMMFATQHPKGIDNGIVNNCATAFYGRMNAPATIDAVQDMMKAKGGGGGDIASMKAGEFYFATEGLTAPAKVRTPFCLSYHSGALSQDEVVERARKSRQLGGA